MTARSQPTTETLVARLRKEAFRDDDVLIDTMSVICEAADRIEYLEARVAILDLCSQRIDCLVRGEAMKQKDGS